MKTKLIIIFLIISSFGFSQNGSKTIDETFKTLNSHEEISYFEVTQEMFKMLSESKQTSAEFKEYVPKLHKLKIIQSPNSELRKEFYNVFLQQTNLKEYSRLMTKKEGDGQLSFYKKEGKNENEFLLISTDMVIYVTGTIDLKSIGEFEQVMEVAGSAFDM